MRRAFDTLGKLISRSRDAKFMSYRKPLFFIFLTAVIFRLAAAFNNPAATTPPVNQDSREYYELGRSFMCDGVLSEPFIAWEPSAHRSPLYPAFLGLFSGGSAPDGWDRARVAVFAASVMMVVLLACAGSELGLGSLPLFFFLFAGGWNFNCTLYIEQFYSLCVLLCAVFAARWAKKPGLRETAMLGASLAVSIACRSVLALLPILLAAWGVVKLKRPLKLAFILLLFSYLPLSVWTARNLHFFGRLIPMEDRAATGGLYAASAGIDLGPSLDDVFGRFLSERPDMRGHGQDEQLDAMRGQTLANIAARPWTYIKGTLRRWALSVRMAFGQSGWLTLPALIIGLWFARRDAAFQALLLFTVYFVSIHSVVSLSSRYFAPLAPVLCILAAYCGRGIKRYFTPDLKAGMFANFVFFCLAALWLAANAGLAREVFVMRGVAWGAHNKAITLMTPAGGCQANGLLDKALARPPSNPATLSKLYSDKAVAVYFCFKDVEAARGLARKALAIDPGNISAAGCLIPG
jgi:hypothetical protein